MVFHWFPEWFLKCTHNQCSLEDAERVLIVVSRSDIKHSESLLTFCENLGDISEKVPASSHSHNHLPDSY